MVFHLFGGTPKKHETAILVPIRVKGAKDGHTYFMYGPYCHRWVAVAPIFSVRGAGHECFHYYNLISDTATPVTTGQRCQTARHRVRGPTLLLLTTTQLSQRRVKPRGHWPLLDPGQHCQGAALKYKSDINGSMEQWKSWLGCILDNAAGNCKNQWVSHFPFRDWIKLNVTLIAFLQGYTI